MSKIKLRHFFEFTKWCELQIKKQKKSEKTEGEKKMTKKELFEKLKDLDDDAVIHFYIDSAFWRIGDYASGVYVEDVVTGDDVENEATITLIL